jgi:hypothetical protein
VRPTWRAIKLGWALSACLAAGCRSLPGNWERERGELAQALAEADAGQLESASQRLRDVIARTEPDARAYAAARLHARAMLAELELRQGLTETDELRAVNQLVSAHWQLERARDERRALERGGSPFERGQLLPEALAARPPDQVLERAALTLCASEARLGAASAADLRATISDQDFPSLRSRLEAQDVAPEARTWIYLTAFERWAAKQDSRALPFAAAVLEERGASVPAARRTQLVDWISSGRLGRLLCPTDGEEYDPQVPVCTACGRSRLEFEPRD